MVKLLFVFNFTITVTWACYVRLYLEFYYQAEDAHALSQKRHVHRAASYISLRHRP